METKKQCANSVGYDSFFPFMWQMVNGLEFDRAFGRLFSYSDFNSDFPATTVEKGCPMYWFDNCIAGPCKSSEKAPHFYGASWNGPVWPYANSGILEALGSAALRNDTLKSAWLDFFMKYTDLHFMGGDRSLPVIVEHYRNTDGVPFSGFADYFHSTWLDPFFKYWAGISLKNGEVVFEPFTDEAFSLSDVIIGDRKYNFSQSYEEGVLKRNIMIKQG